MFLLPSFPYFIFQNLNQTCFAIQKNFQVSAFSLIVSLEGSVWLAFFV